jgi:predicted small lipoprotein YifL
MIAMKKALTLLLLSCAVFLLSACGKKGDVNPPPSYSDDQN